MAGSLTLSTLSDGTNSTSATNAIRGSAKAWVNFDGYTGSIFAAYNVSSVTRNSTGLYTVNFTNAFSDIYYSCVGTGDGYAGSFGHIVAWEASTTTTFQFSTWRNSNNARGDSGWISISAFR